MDQSQILPNHNDISSTVEVRKVYTDGGIIGLNSKEGSRGGTWAYRYITEINSYIDRCGLLLPSDNEGFVVTNNHTELLALLLALENLPNDWHGQLFSDSMVSLGRLFLSWKWTNVPSFMHHKYQVLRERMTHWDNIYWTLLDGHPTKKQLESGYGKRGHPVSEHNVACDKMCSELAREYVAINTLSKLI